MTREEFANFLTRLKTAKEAGQDLDAIVKEHEHRNVYFYNDACIKKILASEKNISLTTDLINAALNLIGAIWPRAIAFLSKSSMMRTQFIRIESCFTCRVLSAIW